VLTTPTRIVRLFSVKPDGGPSVELCDPIDVATAAEEVRIGPDGRRVLVASVTGLQVVSIDGGPVVDVPQSLGATNFTFTSDGKRLLYLSPLPSGQELRVAALARADSRVLSARPVLRYRVTPDGERVVFGERDALGRQVLIGAALGGSASTRELGPAEGVFDLSSDSSRMLFVSGHVLQCMPIDGAAPAVAIAGPPGPFQEFGTWRFTPDGAGAVYLLSGGNGGGLFGVPVDASASPVQLNPSGAVASFTLGGAGRVAYLTQTLPGVAPDLFSVPSAGGPAVRLGSSITKFVGLTPDGTRAFFTIVQSLVTQVFSVPMDGSTGAVLLATHAGLLGGMSVDPLAGRVVYEILETQNRELFSVPIDGGESPVDLAQRIHPFNVFVLSPRRGSVVFAGSRPVRNVQELYSVPVDGSAEPKLVVGL